MLDYDALVAQHGRARWHDEGKWLTVRMPFAPDSMLPMVGAWLKFIHPLTGVVCKVLAVDLDNTLWGGVLGEDGVDGLKLGVEYPGALYRGFQRAILDLYQRGVLLAVCSKNNHDEAMAALQNHPGMLLRPEHFAAFRINWQDKAQKPPRNRRRAESWHRLDRFLRRQSGRKGTDPHRSSGSESHRGSRPRAGISRKPCATARFSSGSRFRRKTAIKPSNITSSASGPNSSKRRARSRISSARWNRKS